MKKERFEWARSWCDLADENNLPRILLIGDSITEGYQDLVRKALNGICYVDYFATSYAVDSKIYNTLVRTLVADSDYKIIHFNHGLHGKHMTKRAYQKGITKLLDFIKEKSKVILANSTQIRMQNNKEVDISWENKVKERNEVVADYAIKHDLPINDLYTISINMNQSKRAPDGAHYFKDGYLEFSNCVVNSILKLLKDK